MTAVAQVLDDPGLEQEIALRRRVAEVLGDAASRRAARERVGLSLADVSEITGLSQFACWYREQPSWKLKRGSLDSPVGWNYVTLMARLKGVDL